MKKVSFFKKWKLFFEYRRIVNKNRRILRDKLNLEVDWVYRPYTVLEIVVPKDDEEIYGDSINRLADRYTNTKSYIDFKDRYVRGFISDADKIFKQIGLSELIAISNIEDVEEARNNVAVSFEFSLFSTSKMANRIVYIASVMISLGVILKICL